MNEEISALCDNETFEFTPLPEGRTLVGAGEDVCTQLNLVQIVKKIQSTIWS